MKNVKSLIFISFLTLLSFNIFSQKQEKIHLLNADYLKYDKLVNPNFQILSGNVSFKYEDATLHCDSARLYINRDYIETYGNVHVIVNDSVQLWGDTLKIDGNNDKATVIGNVKLIDNQITLTGEQLFYNLKNDIAYYYSRSHIRDRENYLTSLIGFYYTQEKNFFFKDSVFLQNENFDIYSDTMLYNTNTEITYFHGYSKIIGPENTLICNFGRYDTKNDIGNFSKDTKFIRGTSVLVSDSLMYNRNLAYGEVFKNIVFTDTAENIIVYGDYGKFFETDSSFFVTEKALMKIINETDTLHLHGDTLFVLTDTLHNQRIMKAYNSVKFFSFDFQGVCDSLVFLTKDSVMYFYYAPVIWTNSTQLIGDTIIITYLNGELNKVLLNNKAFIISKENSEDYNQIKGDRIEADFKENKIDILFAYDNAETLYYVFDDNNELIGINKAKSDKIKITFEDNTVQGITLYSSPSGNLFPEKDIAENEKKLSGFKWLTGYRPLSPEDIFRRE